MRANPDDFSVVALSAGGGNVDLLAAQARDDGLKIGALATLSSVETMKDVIDNCLDIFQERFRHNRIHVETAIDTSCPPVLADADQMSQVVINLIMNAVQAMPQGGTLTVTVDKRVYTVVIEFSDTGVGMPADRKSTRLNSSHRT